MSYAPITVIDSYVSYLNNTARELMNLKNDLYDEYYDLNSDSETDTDNILDMVDQGLVDKYIEMLPGIKNQIEIFQSRTINQLYNFYQSGITHIQLDEPTKIQLLEQIKNFALKIQVDYHPGSNNKVRDLVHPSVYPYIKGKKSKPKKVDFFKRPYESSKYQWLPSEFKIDSTGKCEITSYINNLPLSEKPMYDTISKLFEKILPEFEKAYSYVNSVKIFDNNENIYGSEKIILSKLNLANRKLQVITKIVQVTLGPGESLPGSWHVEGMSHENIIATASCTLEQPDGFNVELFFKRSYYEEEAGYLMMNTSQHPPGVIYDLYHDNLVPVGKADIKSGSLVVFPNNFVHKVDMHNSTNSPLTRTILVFWLVNPDEKIKSTKDILQQDYEWEEVEKVRLELMKERTFYKQTFNQREINLCEH
jgi:hypothetical protein